MHAQSSLYNSPSNIKKFANHLYCEKDYLRAIEEYRRYLKTEGNDTVSLKIILSFYAMEKFDEPGVLAEPVDGKSLFYNDAQYLKLVSLFRLNEDGKFLSAVSSTKFTNNNFLNKSEKLLRFNLLFRDSLFSESFILFPFEDDEKPDIKNFYERKKYPMYKSPVTAAILSALIPGSGKIYAGRTGDG
ncbi:MAG: hypothetical protein K8H86_04860, partial [Ignavibacteriaceae bacterium]|nr:hypothetical protein [Ignavibacteriaceae bacterium]